MNVTVQHKKVTIEALTISALAVTVTVTDTNAPQALVLLVPLTAHTLTDKTRR